MDSISMAPGGDRFAVAQSGINRSYVRMVQWRGLEDSNLLVGDATTRFEVAWLSDEDLLVFVHRVLLGGGSALSSIHVIDVNRIGEPVLLDALERSAFDYLDVAPGGRARLVSRLPKEPDHFLLAESQVGTASFRLTKRSIQDGSRQPVLGEVQNIAGFLAGLDGSIRALRVYTDPEEDLILYRRAEDQPWRTLLSYRRDGVQLLALEPEKQSILVRIRSNQGSWDAYRLDSSSGTLLGPIIGSTTYDVLGVHTSERSDVLAYYDAADRPQLVFVDPEYRRLQQGIDLALPGRFNRIGSSNFAKRRFLVLSGDGYDPAELFALDQGRSSLQQVVGRSAANGDHRQPNIDYERIRDPATSKLLAELYVPESKSPPALVLTVVDSRDSAGPYRFSWLNRMLLEMGVAVLSVSVEGGYAAVGPDAVEHWLTNTLATVRQVVSADPQLVAQRVCIAAEGLSGALALQALVAEPDWVSCAVLVDIAAAAQYTDLASCIECDQHQSRRRVHQLIANGLQQVGQHNQDAVLWVSDSDSPPPAFFGTMPGRIGKMDMPVVNYEADQLPNWRRLPSRDPLVSIRQFFGQQIAPIRQ